MAGRGGGMRGSSVGRMPAPQSLNPRLAAMCSRYFGIDLGSLDGMTDEQLAAYADMAKDAKRWMEIIPILEQHFATIIEGQVTREQFYANVQKAAVAAGKKIDNAILQTFLTSKGYDMHLQRMAQKASQGASKLQAEHAAATQLDSYDFDSYMKIVAMRVKNQKAVIDQKLPAAQKAEAARAAAAAEKQRRMDLLRNGTGSTGRGSGGRGFFGGIFNWFGGA